MTATYLKRAWCCAVLILCFGFVPPLVAADPTDEMVEMCHGGTTIQVQRRFVPRRLQLGDTLGACDCCGSRTGIVFDKETYTVTAGQAFFAKVAICPIPAAGLFSYGVEVTLSGGLTGTGISATAPLLLNFHTVRGAGADTAASGLTVGAKGSVDFFLEPLVKYADQILATILIPGLPPGNYDLTVRARNNLGATEQIFVDGNGNVLDGALTYHPARIVVSAVAPGGAGAQAAASPSPFLASLSVGARDIFGNAELRLQFVAEPGRKYFVQYSSDLAQWTTVLPAIAGLGQTLQWMDSGPPETEPAPSEVAARYYRLLRMEP